MAFLRDDEQFGFNDNVIYSIFLNQKDSHLMWFSKEQNLFYFMVNIIKEGKITCVAFPSVKWFHIKTHFDSKSQTKIENFIATITKK